MSWYLLGVVTESLQGGSPAQHPIFHHAIDWIRTLWEFYMYAPCISHDNATLSYSQDAMPCCHMFNNVFLLGQGSKKGKAKANILRAELMKQWKVDEGSNADCWTPSKKRCKMNAWQDYIRHKMDVSKEIDADFNIQKIHLISHWVEQIHGYGAFQQSSAKRP
jgi:hypothetical protein